MNEVCIIEKLCAPKQLQLVPAFIQEEQDGLLRSSPWAIVAAVSHLVGGRAGGGISHPACLISLVDLHGLLDTLIYK